MRALVWLSNAGFGNYNLSKINLINGDLDDLSAYIKKYTMASNYTGNPSYETNWSGGPPSKVLDAETGVKDSYFLDPKPFLTPQEHKTISAGDIKIDFSLPVGFSIHLGIFNMQGVEIRRFGYEYLPGGRYTVLWDRRDDRGSRAPAGHYVIKLGFGQRSLCDQICIVN
jgi:hypothetical protein